MDNAIVTSNELSELLKQGFTVHTSAIYAVDKIKAISYFPKLSLTTLSKEVKGKEEKQLTQIDRIHSNVDDVVKGGLRTGVITLKLLAFSLVSILAATIIHVG